MKPQHKNQLLENFKEEVGIKFQLYNGLFTSLPFHEIEHTGALLNTLQWQCAEGYKAGKSPAEILDGFFDSLPEKLSPEEKTDLMFRLIQYAERQVVLFDAIEDAAFEITHDMHGAGTLEHILSLAKEHKLVPAIKNILEDFSVLLVLTAHPTQFYPRSVLGIITDLANAIDSNDSASVQKYLQQLGQTPFLKKEKPTPYDEALNLIWYLEHVFYLAIGDVVQKLMNLTDMQEMPQPLLRMGFWPGGDRDGNPFVLFDTTLKVANALQKAVLNCYYTEAESLKRRLTFKTTEPKITEIAQRLYDCIYQDRQATNKDLEHIKSTMHEIIALLHDQHNAIFTEEAEAFLLRVQLFGLHFATLDIRQDSETLSAVAASLLAGRNYGSLQPSEKIELLSGELRSVDAANFEGIDEDTVRSMQAIKTIQEQNGEAGCHRYIISQCKGAVNIWEVFGLLQLSGWQIEAMSVDIVPLFETVDDLRSAAAVMKEMYEHPVYREHLRRRGDKQTIMLGFSDGTKDGGYLMANYSIYKAKESLSAMGKNFGVKVVFFDGRGGPPSRGGGKSHRFYASHGYNIPNHEIQVTVQGQTISSNFGTLQTASYNMEQFISAGLFKRLFKDHHLTIQPEEEALILSMAEAGYEKYTSLKQHPQFMKYLNEISPLKYYADTNIGSRPASRKPGELTLKDLRAIPYMGAWSQIKQNVPGFFGVGTALQKMEEAGKLEEVQKMYETSLFFRTLLDNSEMSMTKSYFNLTYYLRSGSALSEIWNIIYDEYKLAKHYLLKISKRQKLMGNYPEEKMSIQMREKIVLPLSTIQQYSMQKINNPDLSEESRDTWRKLIVRSSFGIINAARNSV